MSRVGKVPVKIPAGVNVSLERNIFTVRGPKGMLSKSFAAAVTLELASDAICVVPQKEHPLAKSLHGTVRAIVQNMVSGVVTPYTKSLKINGVGFKAVLKDKVLELFLGYSEVIRYPIPEGISITVADGTRLVVTGIDKQAVGQVTSDIESYYPAEPYKGRGISVDGKPVRRKEGKKTA